MIQSTLERMTRDELSVFAKKLSVVGHSRLSKAELIDRLLSAGEDKLQAILFPSWWSKYHNHVYGLVGVAGVVLTIVFFVWPDSETWPSPPDERLGRSSRVVTSVETPLRFADFAAMVPSERAGVLRQYFGKSAVWEGYVSETLGFKLGKLEAVPDDEEVGIRITPTPGAHTQIVTDCRFGILGGGDAGLENGMRLHLLTIGQRVRISGELHGDCDHPILAGAFLEAEWPLGE